MNNIRLPLNVERDLVWGNWPEEECLEDCDTLADEGLSVSDSPHQNVDDFTKESELTFLLSAPRRL